jgi:glycine dehydrogenase subunit 2
MENITAKRYENGEPNPRRFHQAQWDEPILFELSTPGQRGILPPAVEDGIRAVSGDVVTFLPESLRRTTSPKLPEVGQPQVVRHYLRLSQENLGFDFNVDVGQGTCTMKYSPKINEKLSRMPHMTAIHPLQPEETVQGILQVFYDFEQILREISGMDRFSLQPGAGSAAIYGAASIIRAYHAERGESAQRSEIITTIFSHPSDAACAKVAGFDVITLYPDEDGYPDLEALKSAVSERTAALMIANPEDTGIFNPAIKEWVNVVHEAGGLCFYDQANANGILGITRARDAGFDLCHFNLHKTFSTPHGCGGPGAGALGVTDELAPLLPVPVVAKDGDRYVLDWNRPRSIGKLRAFYGVAGAVLKAYAWVMSLGAEGLLETSKTAVLNNNYLLKRMREIPGLTAPYAKGKHRIEQVRYSWQGLCEETGVSSEDLGLRAADYGVHYWTSHHPFVVAEPCTLEPTESFSKMDLDEYAAIMRRVAEEARIDPETVRTAPHNSTVHRVDDALLDDPTQWAVTWRAFLKKRDREDG